MDANIIKVGNSKGIIIPAKFLKLMGLSDRVMLAIEGNRLIIEPVDDAPRKGLAEKFEKAGAQEKTELILSDMVEDVSQVDWTW